MEQNEISRSHSSFKGEDIFHEKMVLMKELKQIRQTLAAMEQQSPLASLDSKQIGRRQQRTTGMTSSSDQLSGGKYQKPNPISQHPLNKSRAGALAKSIADLLDDRSPPSQTKTSPETQNYGTRCVITSRETYDSLQQQVQHLQYQVKSLASEKQSAATKVITLESQVKEYQRNQTSLESEIRALKLITQKREEVNKGSVPLADYQKLAAELDSLRRFYDRYKSIVQNIECVSDPDQICIITYKGSVLTSMTTLREELRGWLRQGATKTARSDTPSADNTSVEI